MTLNRTSETVAGTEGSIGNKIMHPCTVCGTPTEGTYLEDGVEYDLCEECLIEAIEEEQFDTDQGKEDFEPIDG